MRVTFGRLLLIIAFISTSVVAFAQSASRKKKRTVPTRQVAAKQPFRIVAYFSDWGPVSKIKFQYITHLNFAFIRPMPDGSLAEHENNNKLYQIVAKAKKHKVKVLVSIGAQNTDKIFSQIAKDTAKMDRFVNELVKTVDRYGLDGVDLDWETPKIGTDEPQKLVYITKKLSARLRAKRKLLTMAMNGVARQANAFPDEVMPYLDFMNLMSYDDLSQPYHSSYEYMINCLKFWVQERHYAREKINIGLPTYGRNPKIIPPYYKDLIKQGASPDDDMFKGTSYNGIPTIRKKVAFALRNAGGIMIWEVNGDSDDPKTSLIKAMKDESVRLQRTKIKRNTNPNIIE